MDAKSEADKLGEVLDQIDHGDLAATDGERAYIAGARDALMQTAGVDR